MGLSMASLYERQYNSGVSWENTPSVSTPIDADNLNKMDRGLQAIDEAVAVAIGRLEEMVDGNGGRDTIKNLFFVTSCVNSNMAEIGGNGNGDDVFHAT